MGVLPIIAARIAGIRQRLRCPFTAAFQHWTRRPPQGGRPSGVAAM